MAKKTGKVTMAFNQVLNAFMVASNEATSISRSAIANRMNGGSDPRRNLNDECGYPESTNHVDYLDMFLSDGMATKVVSYYPNECFAVEPEIYESEDPALTPFEAKLKLLKRNHNTNLLHYVHRLDVQSGIGRFGILLMGFNDKKKLSEPLFDIDDVGEPIMQPDRPLELTYLRVFHEGQAKISKWVDDETNPRNGQPEMYSVQLADTSSLNAPMEGVQQPKKKETEVHWTRVIHAADNRTTSEVYGVERLRNVFNRILDLNKILGSSAEMFYKGGFPGLSIELDPRALEALNIEIDFDAVEDEMEAYMNGLQRYIALIGMRATSLAPQVANPKDHIEVQIQAIAMAMDVPLRIFIGSESGQLASGQDAKKNNRKVHWRQLSYVTNLLLRPLIDRLIVVGTLPMPAAGLRDYEIEWPDLNLPDEDEQSQIADRRAACMMKYVTSGAWMIMQPSDFFLRIMGLPQAEVDSIMANLKKTPEVSKEDMKGLMVSGPQDSGTKDKSPSKPTDGTVKD